MIHINMYALMFYKIFLINESLITHITSIRALSTMYAHVLLDWPVD